MMMGDWSPFHVERAWLTKHSRSFFLCLIIHLGSSVEEEQAQHFLSLFFFLLVSILVGLKNILSEFPRLSILGLGSGLEMYSDSLLLFRWWRKQLWLKYSPIVLATYPPIKLYPFLSVIRILFQYFCHSHMVHHSGGEERWHLLCRTNPIKHHLSIMTADTCITEAGWGHNPCVFSLWKREPEHVSSPSTARVAHTMWGASASLLSLFLT